MKKWFKNLKDAIYKCPEILLLFIIFFVFGCVFVVLCFSCSTEVKADSTTEYTDISVNAPFAPYIDNSSSGSPTSEKVYFHPDFMIKIKPGMGSSIELWYSHYSVSGSSQYYGYYNNYVNLNATGTLSGVMCTLKGTSNTFSIHSGDLYYSTFASTADTSKKKPISYNYYIGSDNKMYYRFDYEGNNYIQIVISVYQGSSSSTAKKLFDASGFTSFSNDKDENYNAGYNAGLSAGKSGATNAQLTDKYNEGYSSGYTTGYNAGAGASVSDVNPFAVVMDTVTSFLNFSPFGNNITFGLLLSLCFIIGVVPIFFRMFAG